MANKLSLYLCSDSVTDASHVLSKRAKDLLDKGGPGWVHKSIPNLGEGYLLITRETSSEPKWKDFLDITFPEVTNVPKNRSTGAILFLEAITRRFVIPFGTGFFSLDESKLVGDFGLMITANEVLEHSLRFLDSNNPSAGMKSRVQSDRLAGASGFDLDSALAFIKNLGGLSENKILGKSVSGSAGLKFNGPAEISLLKNELTEAMRCYKSDTYKKKGLEVIASMKPVKDKKILEDLDNLMIGHIKANDGEFSLTCPVVVDWNVVGVFRYGGWRDRAEYHDLSITDYIKSLQDSDYENWDNDAAFLNDLKERHYIRVDNASDGSQIKNWPTYRCFQGSVENGKKRYALSDGRWFSVADNFREAVLATFQRCRHNVDDNELPQAKIVTREVKKNDKVSTTTGLETEEEYNERAAAALGFAFLDKQTGAVSGVANQRNELCDLLSNDGRLIHVKKGSRTSGQLHHLFRQGATAARMLRDPQFLGSIAKKLEASERLADAKLVKSLGDGKPTIEFRIIDKPRAKGDFNIPFFAKVALHYAEKEIQTTGCLIRLGFINQD